MPNFRTSTEYKSVTDKNGKEIYAIYRPGEDRGATEKALTAFLDLLFEERATCRWLLSGQSPKGYVTSGFKSFCLLWKKTRNPAADAAVLTEQFIKTNERLAALLDVRIESDYDGRDVYISIYSGNMVGAIALASPRSAQLDFGLVVQPRFSWNGIGSQLGEMGWRIAPQALRLPQLRRSEGRYRYGFFRRW